MTMHDNEIARENAHVLLTEEGWNNLHQELDHLTQVKRPEIADRIRESQQHGEFSEDNSELDEVKFEQAIVESRIAELKTIFSSAAILDPETISTDSVGLGSLVKVKDLEFGDDFEIRLVASIESNPDRDFISVESPMGTALFGKAKGELVEVLAPGGLKKFEVLGIRR